MASESASESALKSASASASASESASTSRVSLRLRYLKAESFPPQILPLPQFRRGSARPIYVVSGGPFGMRNARATITQERTVELRDARVAGRTGEIEDYNILASMLPQDSRIAYAQ